MCFGIIISQSLAEIAVNAKLVRPRCSFSPLAYSLPQCFLSFSTAANSQVHGTKHKKMKSSPSGLRLSPRKSVDGRCVYRNVLVAHKGAVLAQ